MDYEENTNIPEEPQNTALEDLEETLDEESQEVMLTDPEEEEQPEQNQSLFEEGVGKISDSLLFFIHTNPFLHDHKPKIFCIFL